MTHVDADSCVYWSMGCLIGGETNRTNDYIIYDFPAGPAMQEVPRPHYLTAGGVIYLLIVACCGSIRTLGLEAS